MELCTILVIRSSRSLGLVQFVEVLTLHVYKYKRIVYWGLNVVGLIMHGSSHLNYTHVWYHLP